MSEQQLAMFEGYAIVEIMGHQKVSGYVTTQYFGGTAVFRVVQQELTHYPNLRDNAATPGEREAAQAALDRMKEAV